tara:strand:- start:19055 stop:19492 length:438 start_codon:yes stop_codon:yes gene_type:complete
MALDFKAEWAKRPWWMNLMWFFCLYMTFIYMPFDMFWKPVAEDQEVWFGFTLHGWYAKATEPLHWLIYGAGAYGFWKMSPWMWPWAAVYSAQVCLAMALFGIIDGRGDWVSSLVAGAIFLLPTIALYRARPAFQESARQAVAAAD